MVDTRVKIVATAERKVAYILRISRCRSVAWRSAAWRGAAWRGNEDGVPNVIRSPVVVAPMVDAPREARRRGRA